MINMLKELVKKVNNIHEQIGSFSKEMVNISKSQMEMLVKNMSEIKNSFNRLSSRLDSPHERINKLEDT